MNRYNLNLNKYILILIRYLINYNRYLYIVRKVGLRGMKNYIDHYQEICRFCELMSEMQEAGASLEAVSEESYPNEVTFAQLKVELQKDLNQSWNDVDILHSKFHEIYDTDEVIQESAWVRLFNNSLTMKDLLDLVKMCNKTKEGAEIFEAFSLEGVIALLGNQTDLNKMYTETWGTYLKEYMRSMSEKWVKTYSANEDAFQGFEELNTIMQNICDLAYIDIDYAVGLSNVVSDRNLNNMKILQDYIRNVS